ncbi:hypothetical protein PFISCL1PPCAC_2485, partial [Pristionchus fissidentatus]
KIPLTVKDRTRPVSIDNSPLYFFWGNLSLPSKTTEGCNFTTSNDNKYASLCNVKEMERCAANISDLPHFTPFKFLSVGGNSITKFAWLCPVGQVCCVWECCDSFPWMTILIVILSIIGISLICCGVCAIYYRCTVDAERREVTANLERIDKTHGYSERSPLNGNLYNESSF